MKPNKLEFPEPYRHEHPPICDGHMLYEEQLTFNQRAADWIAKTVGSWNFIIWQTVIFGIWVIMNATGWFYHWDPYPFILMNLTLSLIASYAASIILISQNREDIRDRIESRQHCLVNEKAEEEARVILDHLSAQNRALATIYETLQELEAKVDVRKLDLDILAPSLTTSYISVFRIMNPQYNRREYN